MTYCFQYYNIYPNGIGKSTFCSSRVMDGSVWSFNYSGSKGMELAHISIPIASWKVKSLKLKGWKIKYSHQIVDHLNKK